MTIVSFFCRFGDTTLQENINADNYRKLHAYYEKYQEVVGQPGAAFFLT
jgi:hypothetical protein